MSILTPQVYDAEDALNVQTSLLIRASQDFRYNVLALEWWQKPVEECRQILMKEEQVAVHDANLALNYFWAPEPPNIERLHRIGTWIDEVVDRMVEFDTACGADEENDDTFLTQFAGKWFDPWRSPPDYLGVGVDAKGELAFKVSAKQIWGSYGERHSALMKSLYQPYLPSRGSRPSQPLNRRNAGRGITKSKAPGTIGKKAFRPTILQRPDQLPLPKFTPEKVSPIAPPLGGHVYNPFVRT